MGKLIVFEGTDGSGKSTQFRLLTERMAAEGREFHKLVFPQYDESSSALVRMYLAGEFGSHPGDVNAYAASSFYAVDRYASYVKVWQDYYRKGGLILTDRYTTSNAVHQGSKEPPERQNAFFSWLSDYEYGKLGLPEPDLVLYLDMPTELCLRLLCARDAADGTHADIHEQDAAYLALCRKTALAAAAHYGWTVLPCARDGEPRPREELHEEIYRHVTACLED